MLKTGFRGERKRILTPSLSQGEGECSDGKDEEITNSEGRMVKVMRGCSTTGRYELYGQLVENW